MNEALRTPAQVTVLGLGLFGGGAGAARYFAERGSRVIVSDSRSAETLAESIESLKGLPIEYRLGGHRQEDFAGSSLVIVNPGVPPEAPALEMARRAGARLETEINLLFALSPAPVAAVTGTNGKSTTTALLAEMLRAAGRIVWLGGNLGGSLLPETERMRAGDVVVIEISSFQCERLAWAQNDDAACRGKACLAPATDESQPAIVGAQHAAPSPPQRIRSVASPKLAMVLNLTPNHFDRHRDMEEYAAAKKQLLLRQGPDDFAILNGEDPILRQWADAGRGRKFFYGASDSAPNGIQLRGKHVRLWREGNWLEVSLARMRLPGAHNRFNAACASAAAWLLGASGDAIERAVESFHGLPDRLELVAEKKGVRFYNDSIATTPESTMVALESFEQPLILIAGGSSKNLSYAEVGRRIARRAKAVVLMGATGPLIERAIRDSGEGSPVLRFAADLAEAVAAARSVAARGDVVLLSPASASFDMFRNYAERGQKFRELVRAL